MAKPDTTPLTEAQREIMEADRIRAMIDQAETKSSKRPYRKAGQKRGGQS